jgi:integrase
MNDLRVRCQCCAQGKDERRRKPRCCAIGLCCRQMISEWMRRQAWTVLQSALTAAIRDELVSRNVAALVKVPVRRARRTPVWLWRRARTFLESARGANDPFYAAYVLMLVLGLRRGEILGLGWQKLILEPARHRSSGNYSELQASCFGGRPRRRHRTRDCLPEICAPWRVGSDSKNDSGLGRRYGTSRVW